MFLCTALLFVAIQASTIVLNEPLTAVGNQSDTWRLGANAVQQISLKMNQTAFHARFKDAEVSINVVITGKNISEKRAYMMIEATEDFGVVCNPFKRAGEVNVSEGKMIIKGTKKIPQTSIVAAYLCIKGSAEKIEGTITFKNPHGYIKPGDFGFIPFSWALAGVYGLCFVYWMLVMCSFRDEVMFHHKVLSVLIILCGIDEILNAYALMAENVTPLESTFMLAGHVSHALRAGGIRYLGLMLAYGWGMARAHVPQKRYFQVFSILYFVLSMIHFNTDGGYVDKVVAVIQCMFDAVFASMVVGNVSDIAEMLENEKQKAKAKFYRVFGRLISGSIAMAFVFASMTILFLQTDWRRRSYQKEWFFTDGCWRLEFCLILMFAMYLFKPSRGSKTYAMAMQLPGIADDDSGLESTEAKETEKNSMIQ